MLSLRMKVMLCDSLVLAAFLVALMAPQPMNAQSQSGKDSKETSITRKHVNLFTVIGISARTNNAKEAGPDGVIGKQWQRFFQDGVLAQIPEKISPVIYAVYTEYESDHHGEYTYVIGASVKVGTKPPTGMVVVTLPAGSFAVITSDKGPLPQVVPAAWQRVFQLEDEHQLNRAYQADFEVYDQRAQNPQDAQVDLYLGMK